MDCALGGGIYQSGIDPTIGRAFENATQFVTPYAASGLDEFFAENWRAHLGANDPNSLWPTVTRARLEAYAPTMHALFEGIDADLKRRSERQVPHLREIARDRERATERVNRDGSHRGRGR